MSVYLDDPRLAALVGPGGPFELEQVEVGGAPVRSFAHAPGSIVDVYRMGRGHRDLVHVVLQDERRTFGDLWDRAERIGRQLVERFGVEPGDRVVLAMRNVPEFIEAFWATAIVGAVVVPLNSWWTAEELAYALADADPTAVFADGERARRILSTGSAVPVVAIRAADGEVDGSVPIGELVAGPPLGDAELAVRGPDDPATILYTSGTTGTPRGVVNTNRGTIANLMNMGFAMLREAVLEERPPAPGGQSGTIMSGPLFHIGGMASVVGGALSGTKVVLLPKWDAAEALRLVEAEGITTLGGVPTMVRETLDLIEARRLQLDIRSVSVGGAPVPPDLPRRAVELFGPSMQLFSGYGCTETTSAVVMNVGVEFEQRLDSAGRPNLTADVEVRDAEGRALPPGEAGEVCVRSPQNAAGYWNDPEATRETFVHGWVRTGDVGYVDDDGFVYIVDRIKDVVIRGGENVYCTEVEGVLFDHPAVADVAVVGIPDQRLGELVCAVVVPRTGSTLSLSDLRDGCEGRLARFKWPEAMKVASALPRNATGKTAKVELRTAVLEALDDLERMGG